MRLLDDDGDWQLPLDFHLTGTRMLDTMTAIDRGGLGLDKLILNAAMKYAETKPENEGDWMNAFGVGKPMPIRRDAEGEWDTATHRSWSTQTQERWGAIGINPTLIPSQYSKYLRTTGAVNFALKEKEEELKSD